VDQGEVTLLDISDGDDTPRGVTEIQEIKVFDLAGLNSDKFHNNATFTLLFNGTSTACLPWDVSASAMQEALIAAGVSTPYARQLLVTRSEAPSDADLWGSMATPAPNGYVWSIYYRGYDGDVPDPSGFENNTSILGIQLDATKNSSDGNCRPFEHFQRVEASTKVQGRTHVVNCTGYGCVDGVALRGNITELYVRGDNAAPMNRTGLPWNAAAHEVKREIERRGNFSRTVEVRLLVWFRCVMLCFVRCFFFALFNMFEFAESMNSRSTNK